MEIVKIKRTVYSVVQITLKPFLPFGTFRETREKLSLSVQRTCFNCSKVFLDTDNVYLGITTKGNKLFCRDCAEKAARDLNQTLIE